MRYWLLKSEPETYSIDDLAKAPGKTTGWDGVRNFQARNFLRDQVQKGDQAFFYHSSCDVPGIAGIVTVVRSGYPDPTAFDRQDDHYDPKSDRTHPTWYSVDVRYERQLKVTLDELREHAAGALRDMVILRRGNRLSVTPVSIDEWQFILSLAARRTRRDAQSTTASRRTTRASAKRSKN